MQLMNPLGTCTCHANCMSIMWLVHNRIHLGNICAVPYDGSAINNNYTLGKKRWHSGVLYIAANSLRLMTIQPIQLITNTRSMETSYFSHKISKPEYFSNSCSLKATTNSLCVTPNVYFLKTNYFPVWEGYRGLSGSKIPPHLAFPCLRKSWWSPLFPSKLWPLDLTSSPLLHKQFNISQQGRGDWVLVVAIFPIQIMAIRRNLLSHAG